MDSQEGSDAVHLNPYDPTPDSPLRSTWRAWGDALRRRRLDGLVAAILDASGPLTLVSSQLLHFGKPLLGEGAAHLAMLLESERDTAAFRNYLSQPGAETQQANEVEP